MPYVIITPHLGARRCETVRSDSRFYGWVLDCNVTVIRFLDGKVERMAVVEKERPGSRILAYAAEWRDLPEFDDGSKPTCNEDCT